MAFFTSLGIENLDIFLIGLMTLGIGTLGAVAYFNNRGSITNRSFLLAALSVICWGVLNLLVFRITDPLAIIWTLRAAVFFALWHAFFVFQLFFVFPKPEAEFPRWYTRGLIPLTALVSLLTLTPLVFSSVSGITEGRVDTVANGPLVPLFGLTAIALHAAGLFVLFRKTLATPRQGRGPYWYVFSGASITYALILAFNLIFPAFVGNSMFAPFAGLFTIPFIAFTAYAVVEYRLFNIKVLATEIIAVILAGITLIEIFTADTPELVLFRVSLFLLVLVFSVLLIKSVIREVEQREHIQALAEELKQANEKLKELDKLKSQFLSIASHDLRAPLTVIRNFMSLLLEGTYGPIPRAAQDGMQQVFDRATDMAKSVETYLNVSRIEQGRMKYDFIDVEAGPLIRNAVRAFGTNAEKKGLAFSFTEAPDLQGKKARLDVAKINEVLNNLLDNSIKYTPSGSITVALERRDDMARVTVRDTGVGMSKETLGRLFQLFSTAPDSQKINISSTGVGLYIAKAHAEAHGGRLWAESEGEGKGSTFILEIPLLK